MPVFGVLLPTFILVYSKEQTAIQRILMLQGKGKGAGNRSSMKASVQADLVYTFKHGSAIVLNSIQKRLEQVFLIVLCQADNASRKLQRKVLSF